MVKFSELNITPIEGNGFIGDKIKIDRILNREIIVHKFEVKASKYTDECLYMQVEIKGIKYVAWTGSKYLRQTIRQIPADKFPFITTIEKKEDDSYQFT
jgi:rRNA-processing protein FCF1